MTKIVIAKSAGVRTLAYKGGPGGGSGQGGGVLRAGFDRRNVSGDIKIVRLGYRKGLADLRDLKYTDLPDNTTASQDDESEVQKSYRQVRRVLKGSAQRKASESAKKSADKIPTSIDLSKNGSFTAVEDQGEIGSCTANAVIGVVEFLLKKLSGDEINLSRRFLYKVTRSLLGWEGDAGADIRTTIKALRIFGTPPEDAWPYADDRSFDDEPDAFIYSYAANFKSIKYIRIDDPSASGAEALGTVKKCLANGFPIAFGFSVYPTLEKVSADTDYLIAMPAKNDVLLGGHAVTAVGFDDSRQAIKIRNSWGADWGDNGYAWLPYGYVEQGLASDFWTVMSSEWIK